jgi:hypothetical protein
MKDPAVSAVKNGSGNLIELKLYLLYGLPVAIADMKLSDEMSLLDDTAFVAIVDPYVEARVELS